MQNTSVIGRSKIDTARIIFLVALGALAFGGGLSLHFADLRLVSVGLVVILALLAFGRGEGSILLAVALLPLVALIRRLTAGPDAYILNDPLALLVIAALLPAALAVPRTSRRGAQALLVLAAWVVLQSIFAALTSGDLVAVAYGSVTQVTPIIIAARLASGDLPRLTEKVFQLVPAIAAFVALYGIGQWIAPAGWDLAWLRSQYPRLISVGRPEPGQFRLFATVESPAALATFLACAVIMVVLANRRARPDGSVIRIVQFFFVALLVFILALTAVRTIIFALPVALLMAMIVDRTVPRRYVVGVAIAGSFATFSLPSLLSSTTTGQERFNVSTLSSDSSFVDRQALLPQFLSSATSTPLGTGAGTSGLAGRLSSADPNAANIQNVDNGFLTRLIETGVPGLLLFIVAVVVCCRPALIRLMSGNGRKLDRVCFGLVLLFVLAEAGGPAVSTGAGIFFWIALGSIAAPDRPEEDLSGRDLERERWPSFH